MVVTEIKSIRNMFLRVIVSKALLEAKLLSRVWFFATPWTVVYQAPQSMQFSRWEYWSGLPFPSPGDLPNPGIEPGSPTLQADTLPSEPPPGKPKNKHCKTWPKRLWLMKLNSLWPPNFLGQGAACECSSASKEIPFFSASLRCYEMPWNRRAHRGRIKGLTNSELERYSQDQQSQSRKSPYLQNNGPHSFCPVGFQRGCATMTTVWLPLFLSE